jgi:ubiquinone/menaquinone biosynthesis C-methylase UbiE
MVAKIFLSLTDYPIFRKIIWKPFYEILAKKFRIFDWHFMNYGYAYAPGQPSLYLRPDDQINRYPIQLYHYLASKVRIEGKDVLEVGSGRGGGSSYINRYLYPKKVTALDIASNAIKWAKEHHQEKDLEFIQGNAEKLPFPDQAFEVVINVESCHAYPSVPKFLAEVKRVLLPSGYFLCTDLRSPAGMVKLKDTLVASGMEIVGEEDITPNVILAIEEDNPTKEQRIKQHVAKWLRPAFSQFAGIKGSKIHKDLQSRALVYHSYVLRKK